MAYLLDANVFMNAKNLHYGFDFCPAFWEWIVVSNRQSKVYSIGHVEDEILAGADSLSEWARSLKEGFFLPIKSEDVHSLGIVSEWAIGQHYEPSAVHTFLSNADYYLVAQALAGRHVVVTHEVPSNSKKKIKIPDACIPLEVKCVTPYSMLRLERARFVLGPPPP